MSWPSNRKVVVPVDFSDASSQALRSAAALVNDPSQIHVVHVLYPLDAVSPGVRLGNVTDQTREQAVRKQAAKLLTATDCAAAEVAVRIGNPGLEIAEYAEEIGAELIVISSHGYHGVKRLLLGSTAERVIRHAKCSVLVLRRSDAD